MDQACVGQGRAILVRDAEPTDVPVILGLIRELASYEREPDAVMATESSLQSALFGAGALVHALVADLDGATVGTAVWFLTFSTWTGRHSLYLEDLFVRETARGAGVGGALMAELGRRAVDLGCARMEWSVLDWNEPAIGFYRRLGAAPLSEWTTYRLDSAALADLAQQG